jgi:hypothetical protein
VFGKQLPNIHASSGLPMDDWTRPMVRSTAALLNFRFALGTRTTGKFVSAAQVSEGASIKLEAASEVLRMNSLRFMFLI